MSPSLTSCSFFAGVCGLWCRMDYHLPRASGHQYTRQHQADCCLFDYFAVDGIALSSLFCCYG